MVTDVVPQRRNRELLMYVLWGGVVEDAGEGKIRYNGGSRKCVLAREGMGVEELKLIVRETVGPGVQVGRIWYSLKYDRNMKMTMEGDSDVRMMFKGNDEHGYVYVSGKDNVAAHVSNEVTGITGRTADADDGKAGGSAGRPGGGSEEEMELARTHVLSKW